MSRSNESISRKTILYMGNFSFPVKYASGKHVLGIGHLLRDLGYKVVYLGMDKISTPSCDIEQTKAYCEGFECYSIDYPQNLFDWIIPFRRKKRVFQFLQKAQLLDEIICVIMYDKISTLTSNVVFFNEFKQYEIPVVYERQDWFEYDKLTIKGFVKSLDLFISRYFVEPHADGCIAISSCLSNLSKKQGLKTVTLPPLTFSKAAKNPLRNNSHDKIVKLICAGAWSPSKKFWSQDKKDRIRLKPVKIEFLKDRYDLVIEYLSYAKNKGCNFQLDLYGITKNQLFSAFPQQRKSIEFLEENLFCHGLRTNDEVLEAIINADFFIFIRDIKRETMAGFPTKFAESISCGTPVITTNTSDLNDYLKEGKNGFFLDFDPEIAKEQLCDVLSLPSDDIAAMKSFCLENNPFHYTLFKEGMKKFLEQLVS